MQGSKDARCFLVCSLIVTLDPVVHSLRLMLSGIVIIYRPFRSEPMTSVGASIEKALGRLSTR